MTTELNHRFSPPLVTEMCSFTEYLYVCGRLEPNYPVPAIPICVDFYPDYVLVTEIQDILGKRWVRRARYTEYPL